VPLAFYNSTLRACKRSRPPAHVEARRLLLEMREHGRAVHECRLIVSSQTVLKAPMVSAIEAKL